MNGKLTERDCVFGSGHVGVKRCNVLNSFFLGLLLTQQRIQLMSLVLVKSKFACNSLCYVKSVELSDRSLDASFQTCKFHKISLLPTHC